MKTVSYELSDEIWSAIQQMAAKEGRPAEAVALEVLARTRYRKRRQLSEEERQSARARLACHIGAVNSGDPHSADNDRIDTDLAREYGSTHDEEA